MAQLILIRGLPGSGKSTMARDLLDRGLVSAHYEADKFLMDERSFMDTDEYGVYLFDHTRLKEAHEWCQNSTRDSLERGESVVVSNTFVKRWEMKPYLAMADELGIELVVHTCTEDYGSIHGVPPDAIERMKANWEEFDY